MGARGNVFDIQRGAMHDGPGIRTAVFLKGCHLNCAWCHNPEARAFERQLFFYHDKCAQCGLCVDACDYGVHRIEEGVHHVAFAQCTLSGNCIDVCPHKALKIVGNDTTVDDVLSEVLADRHFYEISGGGITVTGGEPMAQLTFTRELLARCKESGIHTCLETAGCVAARRFEEISSLVDLYLFDYKLTDSGAHIRYTGVSNELILANLDSLYRHGAAIILRCPIIPGINDSAGHFAAIQELNERYPHLAGIDILPYHNMGNSKALSIGQEIPLQHLKTVPEETVEGWMEQLRALGCDRARTG